MVSFSWSFKLLAGGLEPEAVPAVYHQCMSLLARLAHCGLVHCDFNEFNIMIGPPDSDEGAWHAILSELNMISLRLDYRYQS